MKLPVVWICAAFAAGIVLAGTQPVPPAVWLALAVAGILAGFAMLRRNLLRTAWAAGVVAWFFLGACAATLERVAVPPDHAARLAKRPALDTSEALRWRGRLRSDPVRLPWGLRYEIELEEVEIAGAPHHVTGGLRVSYFRHASAPETEPALRAGDRVEALVRARTPRNFLTPGAFDARAHLARQGVHLTASLRSTELLHKLDSPPPTFAQRMAHLRGQLLDRVDRLYAAAPGHAAVLRAMLLGDYNFIDNDLAELFQKTSAYHVLVISGMHVAALGVFVFWLGRRLRLSPAWTTLATLLVLAAFVAIVEDRPPIERAAVTAVVVLLAGLLFRRVELLNSVSLAALLILVTRPSSLADPSFQLSFLAAGMIGLLALPWMERTSAPYRRALWHLGDVTRDAVHEPRVAQFRLDARAAAEWLSAQLPQRVANLGPWLVTAPCRVGLRLWEVFLLSATIQLGMLPLMAHYFHRVSLAGPLANIFAALLSALIVPVGFVTLGLSALWSGLGAAAGKILGGLVTALLDSVTWFSGWHWANYRIPGPPAWLLVAFFATLVMLAAVLRRSAASRWWQLALGAPLAVLAILVATYPFAPQLTRGQLELAVLDVGQGDSLFLAFPNGRTMLIDGGGVYGGSRVGSFRTGLDIGEQVVSPYLWQRGLQRLDVIALTHAHQDHLDGLKAVVENFRVRELWVGHDVALPAFRELLDTAAARGTRVVHKKRGDSFTWADAAQTDARGSVAGIVLWPESNEETPTASNNDSLVLRLEFGETSLLLPGDIEQKVESELIARGDPLAAGFLKVPHHGSRTSASAGLLAAVAPRVAVMSLGETNPFGHPHAETLERLRAAGVRVLRTDRDGAVTLSSDGHTLRVRAFQETAGLH